MAAYDSREMLANSVGDELDPKRAFIVAAGRARRFGRYTRAVPKEFLPIQEKPILQWVIEEIVDLGIMEIGIGVSSEKLDMMVKYFGYGEYWGIDLRYFVADGGGPAAPLHSAKEWLEGRDFVLALGEVMIVNERDQKLVRSDWLRRAISTARRRQADLVTVGYIVRQADRTRSDPYFCKVDPARNRLTSPFALSTDEVVNEASDFGLVAGGRWIVRAAMLNDFGMLAPTPDRERYIRDAFLEEHRLGKSIWVEHLAAEETRINVDTWEDYGRLQGLTLGRS